MAQSFTSTSRQIISPAKKQAGADKLSVNKPGDRWEKEADQAADAVVKSTQAPGPLGFSFASVPVGSTFAQREETKPPAPESDGDKLKKGLAKAGEAALKTEAGKKLIEKVKKDPLVKEGEKFLDTTVGKVVVGAIATGALAGTVGGLAAAGKPLPFQPPDIPVSDTVKIGASVEGPLNRPTSGMLTVSISEAESKSKKKDEANPYAREMQEIQKTFDMFGLNKQDESSRPMVNPFVPGGIDIDKIIENAKKMEAKKQEKGVIQRKEAGADGESRQEHPGQASDAAQSVRAALNTSGQPLDAATRQSMEAKFDYDFSQVRIHADTQAAKSASEVNARAYTLKNDIVFATGQYQPQTHSGRHLLAHELTHVIQQGQASGGALELGEKNSPAEQSAEQAARAVTANKALPNTQARTGAVIARSPADEPPTIQWPVSAIAEREKEVEAIKVGDADYVLYASEVRTGGSSAWLANNPGNMDMTENTAGWGAYDGKFLQWGKHRFAIFPDEKTGLQAVQSFLRKFQGQRDITLMMNLFAPAGDLKNNPTQYSQGVAKALGVPVTTLVKDLSDAQLVIFANEIQRAEGWTAGKTYKRGDPALPKEVRDR